MILMRLSAVHPAQAWDGVQALPLATYVILWCKSPVTWAIDMASSQVPCTHAVPPPMFPSLYSLDDCFEA